MSDLYKKTARQIVGLLHTNQVSPAELIDAAEARIDAVDGTINALPVRCFDRARQCAGQLPNRDGRDHPGWLGGLPLAIKDMTDVEGLATTFGTPLLANNIAKQSSPSVTNLERRGGLVVAKSNLPEMSAGANTFNDLFGTTVNPWDTRKSVAGSSGGAAAALASGQVWLASGTDLGGSLRTPASYCSVVGLRPTPGRVARHPGGLSFDHLAVEGPMGRTVGDVALMLDAMSGPHPSDPLSLDVPAQSFQHAVDNPTKPLRVAFSPDLGGITPVDQETRRICETAALRFAELGAEVVETCPDLKDAQWVFHTLRAIGLAARWKGLYDHHKDKIPPEVVWNIEKGLSLSGAEVAQAEAARGKLHANVMEFFENHDLLLCPAAATVPFDVQTRWVSEIDGQQIDNYVDWITITYALTLSACPALSLPCGYTASGLPVGLQMLGRPRDEANLLSVAAQAEEMFAISGKVPLDPQII